MFEEVKLLGEGEKSIALETRLGAKIGNCLGVPLESRHLAKFERLLEKHGSRWQLRRGASGGYNCAGHVWASRRTSIYEPKDWDTILADDGYRKVEDPMPDDLVIYREKTIDIIHIGRVVELKESSMGRIPWVVSKWDDTSGEVCHYVSDHCLAAPGFEVAFEYWTDRPIS